MSWCLYASLGNTGLQVGLHDGAWRAVERYSVAELRRDGSWLQTLQRLLSVSGLPPGECRRALICASSPNVAPPADAIAQLIGVSPSLLGRDFTVPMPADYAPPGTLGQDRILSGYAAQAMAGRPCIALDAGTCLTCEAVSPAGALLPIAIAPGLPALRAGLLATAPHLGVGLQAALSHWDVPRVPAGSTADSLLSGLYHSLQATARELVWAARTALGDDAGEGVPVVITGGDGARVLGAIGGDVHHYPLLLLDGLRLLADDLGL